MGGCAKTAAKISGGLVIYIVGYKTDWSGGAQASPSTVYVEGEVARPSAARKSGSEGVGSWH